MCKFHDSILVSCSSSIFEQGQKVNLPHLLLSQFQWLDRIINGKVIMFSGELKVQPSTASISTKIFSYNL